MDTIHIYSLALILVAVIGGFFFNRQTARRLSQADRQSQTSQTDKTGHKALAANRSYRWHSQADYHGYITAWLIGIVTLGVFFIGVSLQASIPSMNGAGFRALWLISILVAALAVTFGVQRFITPQFRARTHVERFIKFVLILLSSVAILTTIGITLSLLFESLRFFREVPLFDFLFGLQWSPQTAIRADQAGQSGAFGAVPIFSGTFLIMLIAMSVAGPVGLMVAIYLSEYASHRLRSIVKPIIEILAGIPTVVYGFFALLTVGPTIRNLAETFGFAVPTQSALTAGVVMGIMIIPLISSLSDDVINAVPQSLRDGSYALGATKSETMTKVVFASALPGIIGAFLLAVSRAIGETMIVVLAAGRAANLTANPFESVTTVTVQIVALLTGDLEFDTAKTLSAFALGLVLFVITLILNVIALTIVRRYRERYD